MCTLLPQNNWKQPTTAPTHTHTHTFISFSSFYIHFDVVKPSLFLPSLSFSFRLMRILCVGFVSFSMCARVYVCGWRVFAVCHHTTKLQINYLWWSNWHIVKIDSHSVICQTKTVSPLMLLLLLLLLSWANHEFSNCQNGINVFNRKASIGTYFTFLLWRFIATHLSSDFNCKSYMILNVNSCT